MSHYRQGPASLRRVLVIGTFGTWRLLATYTLAKAKRAVLSSSACPWRAQSPQIGNHRETLDDIGDIAGIRRRHREQLDCLIDVETALQLVPEAGCEADRAIHETVQFEICHRLDQFPIALLARCQWLRETHSASALRGRCVAVAIKLSGLDKQQPI